MIIRISGSGGNDREHLAGIERSWPAGGGAQGHRLAEIAAHGGMSAPALAIDDQVLTVGEIATFLQAR